MRFRPDGPGSWPEALRTVPERTSFTRTTTSHQLLDFVTALRGRTDRVHV